MGGGYLNNRKVTPKKSLFIGVLVGGIVFGSIGVAATTYFSANQISYTPSDTSWEVSDVKGALDDLYNNKSNIDLTEQTVEKTVSLSTNEPQDIEFTFDELTEVVGINSMTQKVVSGSYPSSWNIYSELKINNNVIIFPSRGDARGSSTVKFTITARGYK